jgi:hypothetical protein
MKLFKTTIFALAALLSVGLAACSDDVEYVPGAQSDGVYFVAGNASSLNLDEESTSFNVAVARTASTAAASYTVTSTDASGLFTIPSSVTFSEDAVNSNLVVSYDPAKLEYDVPYTISLALDGASEYGDATYSVTVTKPAPYLVDKSQSTTGDYTYSQFFNGVDPDLDVTYQYNKYDENQVIYTVSHWGYDVDLNIYMDKSVVYEDGTYSVTVPDTFIGYVHSTYGNVYVADIYTYTGAEKYADYSYYDPEKGTFYLCLVYYCDEGVFANGYETFQLAGFPDYDVSIDYQGTFTDADETQTQAIFNVSVGADATAIVALTSGEDYQSLIKGIAGGTITGTELSAGENQTVALNVSGAGTYTVAAVTFADGSAQMYDYKTFTISTGTVENNDDDWVSIGNADFVDGWLLAGLQDNQGNSFDPFDYIWTVPVQESVSTPGLYRLVNPYGEDSFLGTINENTKKTYITVDVSDPSLVVIEPQYSGFTSTSMGMGDFYICNIEGYYYSTGEYSKAELASGLKEEYLSTCEDGEIDVPYPFFAGDFTDFEYYLWNDESPVPAVIYLPVENSRAPKAVKAHKAAKKVKYAKLKSRKAYNGKVNPLQQMVSKSKVAQKPIVNRRNILRK